MYPYIFITCSYSHIHTYIHMQYYRFMNTVNHIFYIFYICMHSMHRCTCKHRSTAVLSCVGVCEGQGLIWECLQLLFHLNFWDTVSEWTWSSPFRLDWLASEARGPTCLHRLLLTSIGGAVLLTFMWLPGIQPQVPMCSKTTPPSHTALAILIQAFSGELRINK